MHITHIPPTPRGENAIIRQCAWRVGANIPTWGRPLRVVTVLGVLALAACSGAQIQAPDANPRPHDGPHGEGLFSGKSGNILDAFGSGGESGGILANLTGDATTGGSMLGVNAFLWRAALETVRVLPLLSADSAGGVIITDWKISPENTNERVKATVYIFGRVLTAQAVQVQLYKQTLQNGNWVDASVTDATVRQLENAILTRAKVLQVAAQQQ